MTWPLLSNGLYDSDNVDCARQRTSRMRANFLNGTRDPVNRAKGILRRQSRLSGLPTIQEL